jgi:hypothetical protein
MASPIRSGLLQAGSGFLGRRISAWYRAGGAPLPIAAYAPKGAASLAASYTNLANNGAQYNAAPGTAPTFNTATGWTFLTASAQYLTTGVTPGNNWSVIVRFSDASVNGTLLGGRKAAGASDGFVISNNFLSNQVLFDSGNRATYAATVASGVLAIAGTKAYSDGVEVSAALPGTPVTPSAIYIGALDNNTAAVGFFTGKIQAFAVYNVALSSGQVLAVSNAMAAL